MRLRMLQVVHRHGDRLPLHNACAGSSMESAELERWTELLPNPVFFDELSKRFPFRNPNKLTKDAASWPFGHLTQRGVDQMIERGKNLRKEYLETLLEHGELNVENIYVHSTNYMRTKQSAQALLHGMFQSTDGITVNVRLVEDDLINTYEAFPEITLLKKQHVEECDVLQAAERALDNVRSALIEQVPFLDLDSFNWNRAADYFYCRKAHGMACIGDSEQFESAALEHLCFRFQQLYGNKAILKLVVGRLVWHIMMSIRKVQTESTQEHVVFYSGHDVSLLALLHALDADLAKEEHFWPDYASVITFEVLESEEGQWFVRFRMNDEPMRIKGSSQPMSVDDMDHILRELYITS